MNRFYKFFGLILLLSMWFLNEAAAQLTLVSSTPADGAVNVASPATFELTFSSALDTSARFEDPGDFFLGVELFPEDTTDMEPDISLSPDLTTVTISGIELTADTRFTVLLTGAKAQSGDELDRPYVMTFTTGSSLPLGSVSGNITFQNGDTDGALVALFENLFAEDPILIGVVNSNSFSINYVPDGTYFPISVADSNGDGEVDPTSGDAVGFYDANSDGTPDPVVISGGNTISGVGITLFEPTPQTAQTHLTDIASEAQNWAADAQLVAIYSDELNTAGQAIGWSYIYYSQSLDTFKQIFVFGNLIVSGGFEDDHLPDVMPLPQIWVDSDAAMTVAEQNGGGDFRIQYSDAEVEASLQYFQLYHDDPPGMTNTVRKIVTPNLKINKDDMLANLAVWNFNYWSNSQEMWLGIEVNAETGNLLASDALSNIDAARQSALQWASDAALVNIRNERDVNSQGLGTVWGYVFYSANLDTALQFIAVSGTVLATEELQYGVPSLDPLPQNLCSSADAIALAQVESANFRAQHPNAYITAELSRGLSQNPDDTVWRIGYHDQNESFEVIVDEAACGVTSVNDLSEIPTEFALEQNYPNPFNPTTEIAYRLPKAGRVELAIFNLLGQKIKTMVDEIQAAGSYRLNWNATDEKGNLVPSGVYIYRLNTGDFRTSKKMLLVR